MKKLHGDDPPLPLKKVTWKSYIVSSFFFILRACFFFFLKIALFFLIVCIRDKNWLCEMSWRIAKNGEQLPNSVFSIFCVFFGRCTSSRNKTACLVYAKIVQQPSFKHFQSEQKENDLIANARFREAFTVSRTCSFCGCALMSVCKNMQNIWIWDADIRQIMERASHDARHPPIGSWRRWWRRLARRPEIQGNYVRFFATGSLLKVSRFTHWKSYSEMFSQNPLSPLKKVTKVTRSAQTPLPP